MRAGARRAAHSRTGCRAQTAAGQIAVDTAHASRRDAAARRPGAGRGGQCRQLGAGHRCASTTRRPARVDVGVRRRRAVAQPEQLSASPGRLRQREIARRSSPRTTSCAQRRAAPARQASRTATDIARLAVQVPAPGRVDGCRCGPAGCRRQPDPEQAASVPVTLRYDPEPPQLAFEQPPASRPDARVSVQVTDKVSGLADGSIEISRAGSTRWQALPTQHDGTRLVDANRRRRDCPPGDYVLRATAHDQARQPGLDERSGSTASRWRSRCRCASPRRCRRASRASGSYQPHGSPPRQAPPRPPARHRRSRRAAACAFGQHVQVAGRLANRDGQRSRRRRRAGALARSPRRRNNSSASCTPTPTAAYTLHGARPARAAPCASRTRAHRRILPAQARDPAARRRRRARCASAGGACCNGQAVTFSGHVRTLPLPAGGKLLQLEVRLSHRWQTFRTTRTDASRTLGDPLPLQAAPRRAALPLPRRAARARPATHSTPGSSQRSAYASEGDDR